jgi:glutamate dehydrogenase (NAD(P)+)
MAWIADTVSMLQGQNMLEIVTGKPINLGGSLGRREATGRGVAIVTAQLLERLGRRLDETRVAVQGYGNVGSCAATILHEMGARIVGVSDVTGGLYNANGLDISAINRHVAQHPKHLLEGFHGDADRISNAELLTCATDVLVPAALEHQINGKNAAYIQAKMVVEGANGPCDHEGDAILRERGIVVVPDILANAGGVAVSYLEWVQDLQVFFWQEEEVNRQLRTIMTNAFKEVYEYSEEQRVPMRLGAQMLAVNRVATAIRARGVWP